MIENIKKFLAQNYKKQYIDVGIVLFAFVLSLYLDWTVSNAAALSYVVFYILFPLPSVFYTKLTLAFLGFSAILSIMGRDSLAESFAVLAFCSLIFMIIKLFAEQNEK